jgi:hypothetical protein
MVAEPTQLLGLEGVYFIKRWLESTTHVDLPWNVYEDSPQCTLVCLDGQLKRFDLAGHFLGLDRRPLVVEAKKYSTPGHQGTEYVKYLAIAYSSTVRDIQTVGDTKREYLWVTSHPFSQGNWKDLLSRKQVEAALGKHPELLAGKPIDDDVVEKLSNRLWLLVLHDKQDGLLLTAEELYAVHGVLKRKEARYDRR